MGHVEHRDTRRARWLCDECSDTAPRRTTGGRVDPRPAEIARHRLTGSTVVPDDPAAITAAIERAAADPATQAIILTGGTGLSRRDSTFEAIDRLLEKRLDGFGELFRWLSFQEIGPPAMLSRATAGLYQGKVLFSLPGSEGAVRLAMERLILPELGHVVWLAGR
jgi:molybdenum cofactor biosynthesis protein B